jgi:hypothetical protein
VLRSQCLDRRIATREQLVSEIDAWERQRNASGARIKWMFTTAKARVKMMRAYPELEAALSEEPRPGAGRKLSGKEEALLVATACSKPPQGRARWTLELLAGALVRLTEHDTVSRETVRRRLAENDLKPSSERAGARRR